MKRQRGFTIIELLVAMSVILILAGMLFLGARYMTASTKKNATRTMLQNLRAMVTEREVAVGASKTRTDIDAIIDAAGPPAIVTVGTKQLVDASTIGSVDVPDVPPTLVNRTPKVSYTSGALAQPNNVVGATQFVIAMLISQPSNKTTIGNLPKQQFLEPKFGDPVYNPPILMDGYNNPIIACPSTGLANVVTSAGVIPPITSPDGKPFFASAGPDGVFGFVDKNGNGVYDAGIDVPGGDDNVYSFEN